MIEFENAVKRAPSRVLLQHEIVEVINEHVVEVDMRLNVKDRHRRLVFEDSRVGKITPPPQPASSSRPPRAAPAPASRTPRYNCASPARSPPAAPRPRFRRRRRSR